ncbi:hypothetical protein [Actinomadura sp. NPDC000600]|uniref:hypothetical protein n=1 Tax=Actinomadura sp. NPDC000600 TaxID=3154262 RepID=UPI0033960E55
MTGLWRFAVPHADTTTKGGDLHTRLSRPAAGSAGGRTAGPIGQPADEAEDEGAELVRALDGEGRRVPPFAGHVQARSSAIRAKRELKIQVL